MSERRQNLRQKSFLRGRIDFHDGRFSLDCMIRDLSHDGARIIFGDFAAAMKIPDIVDLHVPQKKRTSRAFVTWRHSDEIGLAFSKTERADSPVSTDPDLAERVTNLESEIVTLRQLLNRMMNKVNAR